MGDSLSIDYTKAIKPLISDFQVPHIFPKKGIHPRILMTPASVLKIRKNLSHADHRTAYAAYLKQVETSLVIGDTFCFDNGQLAIIRAKAAAYPLLEDAVFAREAITAILQVLRGLYISPRPDICRAYGLVMYTAACVYDWTHPLLTEKERAEIVFRCEYELGTNFEIGFPPSKQGMVTGHGSEAQLFRDWISLGIAAYDEYPDIYTYVAGRIVEEGVPPRNFYYRSHTHWQGSLYGPYRYNFDLFLEILIDRMSDGSQHLFDPVMKETAITLLCAFRADGEPFRIGDDPSDNGPRYSASSYCVSAFYAASLYRDPMLRDYAFCNGVERLVNALDLLLLDDPQIGRLDYRAHLPRVRYSPSPRGQYLAHQAAGASVYFKVGEAYSANHEAKDCGHFMIYYKGSLASAANCYQYTTASGEKLMYGSVLDFRYNKQTVSHNCMLVYDPYEEVSERWGNCGGQLANEISNLENATLEDWMKKPTFKRARILFHADETADDGSLSYCVLGGDLSNAYSDKVRDYRRTSLAVATKDADRPLAVFIYDRLVTRESDAEKTWQMHTMGKYEIRGTRAITRHPDGGCLVLDCLLPLSATLDVIGNEEERFIVRGENLAQACDPNLFPIREDGRGRLTVTPTRPLQTDQFLQAMYVTDCGKSTKAKATLLSGDGYVAAALLGVVALFPTEVGGISSFDIDLGSGARLYATNLTPGIWSDGAMTYCVTEENRVLVAYGFGKRSYTRLSNGGRDEPAIQPPKK